MKRINFEQKNRTDWKLIHSKIFPGGIPDHYEWENLSQVVEVLQTVGSISNSNHTFFPTMGGLDLEGCKRSNEPACIELDFGIAHVVKPKKLSFEGLSKGDLQWNYFRLELDKLLPCGVYQYEMDETRDLWDEEVTEISPGIYVDSEYGNIGRYEGEDISETSRTVTRMFGGVLVIFSKCSVYNDIPSTYDGRHNKMTAEEFRTCITEMRKCNKILNNKTE